MRTVLRGALSAALLAASAGCSLIIDPNSVEPPSQQAALGLSTNSLTWNLAQGAAPTQQTVTVTNTGKGTLAAPVATITYGDGSGWLTAVVQGSAAPYSVRIQPSIAALAVGTHTATVRIASPGASNTPQTVAVTVNVGSASQPTIALSSSSLTFGAFAGASAPAQTVTISNSGTGALATPVAAVSYTSGAGGWLTAAVTGGTAPYTLTVGASASGLTPGSYAADISVTSAGASNSPMVVHVAFEVGSTSASTIALSTQSLSFSAVQGGASPASQTITVSNSGTGSLAVPSAVPAYTLGSGGWLGTTVSGVSAPYTMTVQANPSGLAAGTYQAVLSITCPGASNSPTPVVVTLTVGSASQPTIALSTSSLDFSAQAGTAPAPKTVTVSNSGTGSLTAPTTSVAYDDGSGWLTATVSGASAPYTVTVQPSAALPVGMHTATVSVLSAGASNSPQTFQVTVNVGSASQPTMALSTTVLSFSAIAGGAQAAAEVVTVSNSGSGSLAKPTAATTYGDGNGWLNVGVSGAAAPFTVTVQPSASLAAGTHTATIALTSAGASNSPQQIDVTVTVGSASQPTIALSTSALTFAGRVGTALPAAQLVSVTNFGAGTLASPSTSIAYGSGGAGWLTAGVTGAAPGPYTITVQPDPAGLGIGDHTATVSVSSTGASNNPQTFTVTLRLTGVTGCVTAAGGHQLCGSVASAGAAAADLTAASGHGVRQGKVQAGGQVSAAGPSPSDHKIRRGTVSPGAAKTP